MGYVADSRSRLGRTKRSRDLAFSFGKGPASGGGSATELLLGTLAGANFNSTADQSITLTGGGSWRITKIYVTNASTSMTTAAGGFYTGAGKTGTIIVLAAQAYSALTSSTVVLSCSIASPLPVTSTLYFALTTAQGSAATADISVYGVKL